MTRTTKTKPTKAAVAAKPTKATKATKATKPVAPVNKYTPEVFDDLVAAMQTHHAEARNAHRGPMFTVKTDGLSSQWVEALGQGHNCDACRSFIRRMGGAVFVTAEGNLVSAVWPALPKDHPYYEIVTAIKSAVEHGQIVSALYVPSEQAGSRSTWSALDGDEYGHLNVKLVDCKAHVAKDDDIGGKKSESVSRKKYLSKAIVEWDIELLRRGLHLVSHDSRVLYGNTVKDMANFLWEFKETLSSLKKRQASNFVWNASTQFPGWAAPRGTAYGAFLQNLSKMGEDDAIEELNKHTKPENYQVPKAEATTGNIERAERLVKEMNLESALKRREAELSDIPEHGYIWKLPEPDVDTPSEGVFGGLKAKSKSKQHGVVHGRVSKSNMTWEKFLRVTLPTVLSMRVRVPLDKFSGATITAAVDSDSAPLFKWDYDDARNQLGFMTYTEAHEPDQWSLKGGTWVDALAVVKLPWNMDLTRRVPKFVDGAVIVVKDARDQNDVGNGLFPVALRPELFEVRATIQQFSEESTLHPVDGQCVAGMYVHVNNRPFRLEVTTKTGVIDVTIDRFD